MRFYRGTNKLTTYALNYVEQVEYFLNYVISYRQKLSACLLVYILFAATSKWVLGLVLVIVKKY